MVLINLLWILQNLADYIPEKRRILIREWLTSQEQALRVWEGVHIGDATHLKNVEAALDSFVQPVKITVGTRAWDLNMHRMRQAITTATLHAQFTKSQPPVTTQLGNVDAVVTGFQKTRYCEMTWERLRAEEP